MTRLMEIPRQNGKSTLFKRIAAIDPRAKDLTQDIFKGQPDWVKSAIIAASGHVWYYNASVNKVVDPKYRFFETNSSLFINLWMKGSGGFEYVEGRVHGIDREFRK